MLEKRRNVSKVSTEKEIVFDNGDNRGQFLKRGIIANDEKEKERERKSTNLENKKTGSDTRLSELGSRVMGNPGIETLVDRLPRQYQLRKLADLI